MRQLPGYISDDAPAVALSEQIGQSFIQMLEKAFAYCRSRGIIFQSLNEVFLMVAGSLVHAGISTEEMKYIMDFAIKWFINHPTNWKTTLNPQTGKPWLASLHIPDHL